MRAGLAWTLSLLIWIRLPRISQSDTIADIITARHELQRLRSYISNLPIMSTFSTTGTTQYTFFAPNNDAFGNISATILMNLNAPAFVNQLQQIFCYHTVPSTSGSTALTSSMLTSQILSSYAIGQPKLFISTLNSVIYVNGAELLVTDIVASNGVVHIINCLFYDVGRITNSLSYILQNGATGSMNEVALSQFALLLTVYDSQMNNQGLGQVDAYNDLNVQQKLTMFVVSDTYLDPSRMAILRQDISALKMVVESHLINGIVLHTNLLQEYVGQGITAKTGTIMPKMFGSNLYVSNNCAQGQVVRGNITTTNGVIHVLNNLLAYTYNDIISELNTEQDLSKFAVFVRSTSSYIINMVTVPPGTTAVPSNQMYTMFAPNNAGIGTVDITQDGTQLNSVILMHMVQGIVQVSQITNATVLQTMSPGVTMTFTLIGTNIYVNVLHVTSQIITPDICVKNGVIQKVDHIIGVPIYTIMDQVQANGNMLSLLNSVIVTGLSTYLSDITRQVTFFAPVDSAFAMMQTTAAGRKLLSAAYVYNLQRVMYRHIVESVVYLDTIAGFSYVPTKLGDTLLIVKVGSNYTIQYQGLTINITTPNLRMINGVMHIIDGVLYSANPTSLEWTSGATRPTTIVNRQTIPLCFHITLLAWCVANVS